VKPLAKARGQDNGMVEHPGMATDPAAWATNRIVRVGPGSESKTLEDTRRHIDKRGHPNAIAER
jgi:hypothetical protein